MSDTTLTHNTLGNLFEDIADAIREKNPSAPVEDSMVADTFPTEIRAIPSGGSDNPRIEWETNSGSFPNVIHLYNITQIPQRLFDRLFVESTTNTSETDKMISSTQIKDETNSVESIGNMAFISSFKTGSTAPTYKNQLLCGLNLLNSYAQREDLGETSSLKNIGHAAFKVITKPDSSKRTNATMIDLVLPSSMADGGLSSNMSTTSGAYGIIRTNSARFESNFHIRSVTFKESALQTIGNTTFNDCDNLTSVSFPENCNIQIFEAGCFANCPQLENITIPASVKYLNYNTTYEGGAFKNCSGLSWVKFLGTPTTIHANTFEGCSALTDIYVPWGDGEVANAPWGATSATIHYNWTPTP